MKQPVFGKGHMHTFEMKWHERGVVPAFTWFIQQHHRAFELATAIL